MVVRLFRLLRGYVCFVAQGGFSERFINLCAFRRIDIWDVKWEKNELRGKIAASSFHKLRYVARKTGVRVKIEEKSGLPFYIKAHSNRVGLIVGAVFFIAFCGIMNSFVWCISVDDSEKFSREQIVEAGKIAGLNYGVRVSSFDEEKAAREIYKAFDGELSYVKVNIKGSLAAIQFRDSKKKLTIEDKGEPSNIVADFDGVIVSDEVYQGVKNISKGNAVRKGDVLISGVVEGIDSKPLFYEAKGKFTALRDSQCQVTVDANKKVKKIENEKNFYSLIVFGLRIPLSFNMYPADNQREYINRKYFAYDGYILPFALEKKTLISFSDIAVTPDDANKIACIKYSESVYDKYKNSNILSENVRITSKNSRAVITGEYRTIDFIGESKPIIIENTEN